MKKYIFVIIGLLFAINVNANGKNDIFYSFDILEKNSLKLNYMRWMVSEIPSESSLKEILSKFNNAEVSITTFKKEANKLKRLAKRVGLKESRSSKDLNLEGHIFTQQYFTK